MDEAIEFRGRGLVEPATLLHTQNPDPFEQPEHAKAIRVGCVFRCFKADRDMGLGAQVINLVGLHILEYPRQVGRIGQIAVMEDETLIPRMRVFVDMVDPLRVELRRTALDAVHFVSLFKE